MGLRNNSQAAYDRYGPKAKRIDDRGFVKAWMTSETVDDICQKLGLTKTQVSSKANTLRRKGVKLPRKRRARDFGSVDELNKLISKYGG